MHVFNAGDQKTTDFDVTALNRIADFGEVSDSKGSNPGGLGGLMGPEKLWTSPPDSYKLD